MDKDDLSEQTTRCPYCSGNIVPAATACQYCGNDLTHINKVWTGDMRRRIRHFAFARGLIEIASGGIAFIALVLLTFHRASQYELAGEFLGLIFYFSVRATLSLLMIYSGFKSSGKNPTALFGLNIGLGLAFFFLGIINILDFCLVSRHWTDLLPAILYVPIGVLIILLTLMIRSCARSSPH